MNRRTLLLYSAATLSLAALGTTALVHEQRDSFIPALLHALIGDFRMDRHDQRQFVEALVQHYGPRKFTALLGLYRIRAATGLGTAYSNAKLDRFERMLVTDFITSTDYLDKRHEQNPKVSFSGYRLPCRNPFARFTGLA